MAKFGGTSLADAEQFRKAAAIVKEDSSRHFVVVSAPGKRSKEDQKVTDLLIQCAEKPRTEAEEILLKIQSRYKVMVRGLGVTLDVDAEFARIAEAIGDPDQYDYIVSRGEYLNGRIMAELTGFDFIDAQGAIWMDEKGNYDEVKTKEVLGGLLTKAGRAVIPGFYGSLPDGSIKAFSRGGSDITGAIVAAAVGADIYENWTDVSGFLIADPRIVDNPLAVPVITYKELRELSYMGAAVMHEAAVFPVVKLEIPINIRNTNRPEDSGTMIVKNADYYQSRLSISGISGKKGFTTIVVEKPGFSEQPELRAEILELFSTRGISIKNLLSGIDSLTIVVRQAEIDECEDVLIERIKEHSGTATVTLTKDIAMIAVVGRELFTGPGVAVKVLSALASRKINIRLIDHGSEKINMLLGVDESDYISAVQAIYTEFTKL